MSRVLLLGLITLVALSSSSLSYSEALLECNDGGILKALKDYDCKYPVNGSVVTNLTRAGGVCKTVPDSSPPAVAVYCALVCTCKFAAGVAIKPTCEQGMFEFPSTPPPLCPTQDNVNLLSKLVLGLPLNPGATDPCIGLTDGEMGTSNIFCGATSATKVEEACAQICLDNYANQELKKPSGRKGKCCEAAANGDGGFEEIPEVAGGSSVRIVLLLALASLLSFMRKYHRAAK